MAGSCRTNSYFDGLTSECVPCELRCSNLKSQPAACKDYTCNNAAVSSTPTLDDKTAQMFWIIIALLPLLSVTVFLLIVVIRILHRQKESGAFKSTEITVDRNIIVASIMENGLAKDVTNDVQEYPKERIPQSEKFLQNDASNCTSPENQIKEFIHYTQSSGGYDATFPLPATEEGSTVLVTTKTMEWCGSQKV